MLDAATASRAYTDFSQFAEMRARAKENPDASLEEVARQFESIFISMMMKSMRDASFGDPLFNSNQSEMYQEMFDKQIALDMSKGKGLGLADALITQMRINSPNKEQGDSVSSLQHKRNDPFILNRDNTAFTTKQQFVDTLRPYAEDAAEELGVDANVLIAQAALETGWGKAIGKSTQGKTSYNLFNIKAQAGYDGGKFIKQTVEIYNGIAKTEKATFRSYNNYQESFNDYVDFIKSNPRYSDAVNLSADSQEYIEGIHQAGYATDPHYADKIKNVMQSLSFESEMNAEDFV